MEDVDAAQGVLLFHRLDPLEQRADVLARNRAVHAVIVGRDPPGGREGVLAPAPEAQPFGLALGHRDPRGARAAQHLAHPLDLLGHFLGRAVRFAQQDGGGVEVVASLDELLHGGRGGLVHHFQAGRDDAGGNHVGHGVAAFFHIVEAGHDDLRELRLGNQPDGDLGGDGQHALGADQRGQQVQARGVGCLGAEDHHIALHRHGAHAQHVVHGEAVLEAVHAARVLGHVAADGAGDLRGRVGCVIEIVRRGGLGDGQVAHAGLDHGGARIGIDREDALELGQRQHQPAGDGHRPAREARAGAARHHRHPEFVAQAQDGADLLLGVGQHYGLGHLAVGGQAVALVRHGVLGLPEHGGGRQDTGQAGQQCGAGAVGLRGGAGQGVGVLRGVHGNSLTSRPPRITSRTRPGRQTIAQAPCHGSLRPREFGMAGRSKLLMPCAPARLARFIYIQPSGPDATSPARAASPRSSAPPAGAAPARARRCSSRAARPIPHRAA
ncbi:hypothetical protein D3C72_930810 [compost metagenome]